MNQFVRAKVESQASLLHHYNSMAQSVLGPAGPPSKRVGSAFEVSHEASIMSTSQEQHRPYATSSNWNGKVDQFYATGETPNFQSASSRNSKIAPQPFELHELPGESENSHRDLKAYLEGQGSIMRELLTTERGTSAAKDREDTDRLQIEASNSYNESKGVAFDDCIQLNYDGSDEDSSCDKVLNSKIQMNPSY